MPMTRTNNAQRHAIKKFWLRYNASDSVKSGKLPAMTYREFRATVQGAFMGDCIMFPWLGMWIGVELDGYAHS